MDRSDCLDIAVFAGVGVLEEKPYGLAEAGLPHFVRPLHERYADWTELHFGGGYTPVVGNAKTKEYHPAPLTSRRRSIKAWTEGLQKRDHARLNQKLDMLQQHGAGLPPGLLSVGYPLDSSDP